MRIIGRFVEIVDELTVNAFSVTAVKIQSDASFYILTVRAENIDYTIDSYNSMASAMEARDNIIYHLSTAINAQMAKYTAIVQGNPRSVRKLEVE